MSHLYHLIGYFTIIAVKSAINDTKNTLYWYFSIIFTVITVKSTINDTIL